MGCCINGAIEVDASFPGFVNGTCLGVVGYIQIVVQGGGYTETFEERELFPPIINESGNGLKNRPMTVAMARFDDPHSATSQFFFNLKANESLDPNSRSWGYAVFADVLSGQDVIEAIAAVETGYSEGLDAQDVPLVPVRLIRATVLEEPH